MNLLKAFTGGLPDAAASDTVSKDNTGTSKSDDQGNKVVRAALEAELDKRTPKAAKPKAVKSSKTKKSTPSLDAIKARGEAAKKSASTKSKAEIVAQLADLEDAPY